MSYQALEGFIGAVVTPVLVLGAAVLGTILLAGAVYIAGRGCVRLFERWRSRRTMALLMKLMETELDARERRVVSLRFGLYTEAPQTYAWIAGRMGISRGRARQIEAKGIAKLFAAMSARGFSADRMPLIPSKG